MCVQALHTAEDASTRRSAERWLEAFQERAEAWQVCDAMLHQGSKEEKALLLFCAQTLRRKMQKDFEQLPPASVPSLRDSVVQLLLVYSNGSPAVRTQLAIALAALVVQMEPLSAWDGLTVLHWICNRFAPNIAFSVSSSSTDADGNSNASASAHGTAINGPALAHPKGAPATHSLLEVLSVLPEEARSGRIAVRPQRRREVLQHLACSVPAALQMIWSCCPAMEDSNIDLKGSVLRAVAEWIHLDVIENGPNTCTQAHDVINSGLLKLALNGLRSDELFDPSVEAVSELIRLTKRGGGYTTAHPGNDNGAYGQLYRRNNEGDEHEALRAQTPTVRPLPVSESMMPLARKLVEEVMMLRSQFSKAIGAQRDKAARLDGSGGEFAPVRPSDIAFIESGASDCTLEFEDARGIARLFADIGESYVELIAHGGEEAVSPMEAMLQVLSHPDFDIAELGFSFWQDLATQVAHSYSWEQERHRKVFFAPAFHRVLELLKSKVVFPDDFETRTSDGRKDFLSERRACIGPIQDATAVIGGSAALQQLCQPVGLAKGKPMCNTQTDLANLEATLFCIESIAQVRLSS